MGISRYAVRAEDIDALSYYEIDGLLLWQEFTGTAAEITMRLALPTLV